MRKLYMIGNTHFDPVWLWKWDEAMASIMMHLKKLPRTPKRVVCSVKW